MAVPQRIDEEFNQRYYSEGKAANDPNYVKSVGTTSRLKPGQAANDASYVGERRKNADRSNIVRNVRTDARVSSMPGSPRNQPKSPYETTDQAFNRAYSEKGIQPSSALGKQTPDKQLQQRTDNTRNLQVEYSTQPVQGLQIGTKGKETKTSTQISTSKAKLRAVAVSYNIWSIGFYTWLFLQLPLAILSILFFGAALTIDSLLQAITLVEEDDWAIIKFFKEGISVVGEKAGEALSYLTKSVGFDITQINPTNAMFLMMIIIMSYAIILLFSAWLQYKLRGLNPLFGEGGGSKIGLFLLAFLGYTIPVFNLMPWFFPWTVAVILHPK